MISGLPDRPLSASETLRVSQERDDLLVIPATPDSLLGAHGSLDEIRNVLVFTANVVAALAYTDADGWTVVAKADDPAAFEDVLDELIDFRGDLGAGEDKDEIVRTIAEAYKTFTDRTLPSS
jgi:hypothetical protein